MRETNSYYSNLIEGHKTLPRDIERALRHDYSTSAKQRENQHLAAAHIVTERAMVERLRNEPELNIHGRDFLCWLHRHFYAQLPESMRHGRTVSGSRFPLNAGSLRTYNVDVGCHTPPDHRAITACMERFDGFYARHTRLVAQGLLAAASAHHRLTWIHPFGDGNGRVARLHSCAFMIRLGMDGAGLWSVSRGLARHRAEYYARLAAADEPRMDDYDGRGALSARGLAQFCTFFLDTMLDQIRFMGELLQLHAWTDRIENYVFREAADIGKHKDALSRLLKAVVIEGEVRRGRVGELVGLKASAARQVTRQAVDRGLVTSATPKGPLRIACPAHVLESWFPRLFLDLPEQ